MVGQRAAQLIEHRAGDRTLMTLHLDYFLDLSDAELIIGDHIDTFIATLFGHDNVLVVHRFKEIPDESLKPVGMHLGEPLPECRDLIVVVFLDGAEYPLMRMLLRRRDRIGGVGDAFLGDGVGITYPSGVATFDDVEHTIT